jgi:superfamily II DNA/RNA helicase
MNFQSSSEILPFLLRTRVLVFLILALSSANLLLCANYKVNNGQHQHNMLKHFSSVTPRFVGAYGNGFRTSFRLAHSSGDTPDYNLDTFFEEEVLIPRGTGMKGQRDIIDFRINNIFNEKVEFSSIANITAPLCSALKASGFEVATSIQYKSFETIYSGLDVVIGAETGSGKTFSYLLPLIQRCLTLESEETLSRDYPTVVIMTPTKVLAKQIVDMSSKVFSHLQTESGSALSIEFCSDSSQYWPYQKGQSPTFLVCTPRFLCNFIKGPIIKDPDLFTAISHMVLDEADMLLDGSFLGNVESIVDSFKMNRRRLIREGLLGINDNTLQNIIAAATLSNYGLKSVNEEIAKRFPRTIRIMDENLHKHHPSIYQEYILVDGSSALEPGRVLNVIEALASKSGDIDQVTEKEHAGADMSDLQSVVEGINSDAEPTMIFVNTAASAKLLAEELRSKGISTLEFHSMIFTGEKEQNIQKFRNRECKVLVCTDSAARGLDLPFVRHVIQAEFALNVVQHMHRIGRASRAGNPGRATNFYDRGAKDLVDKILSSAKVVRRIDPEGPDAGTVSRDGQGNVEDSFSRKRGFRKKLKKQKRVTRNDGFPGHN